MPLARVKTWVVGDLLPAAELNAEFNNILNNPVSLITAGSTWTQYALAYASTTAVLASLGAATNGQLPIGSTSAAPVLATLTGTANQITVTNGAGSITLATPQSIATGSSPTFANLTLTTALNIQALTNQIVLDSDAAVNTGTLTMAALNGARVWTFPNVTGTVITTGDSGSVTNAMLAGSIAASKLIGTDIATVGTVTSGVWQGTAVANGYLASALTGKTYASSSQAAFTLNPFGAAAGNTGEIRFLELAAGGTSYVGFKAPDALAGNVIWTLPSADASVSGYALTSNASGVLSWAGAGVALGDNPTWTGTHTWNGGGPRVQLTAVDSQVLIGDGSDPGWTVGAFLLTSGTATRQGALVNTVSGDGDNIIHLTHNAYWDGAWKRWGATSASRIRLDSVGTIFFDTAATGTAGSAITWLNEGTIGGGTRGMILGAPTGGQKGEGTLNAVAVYDDNVILTDWALDLYFDGKVRAGDPFYRGGRLYPFTETFTIAQQERRLPWMPTRESFEHERSLGGLISRLWFGQEQQQMYFFDYERRLQAVEDRLSGHGR